MTTPNPMEALPAPPPVSQKTTHMAGLLVDVYGLAELPSSSNTASILWLHHPRLRAKEDMADIAARCISEWYARPTAATTNQSNKRGLIALAFDQRNHGSRIVHPLANEAWRHGNTTHAQDMFGIVAGTVADTSVLMDAAEGYLFPDGGVKIVQHVFLGVSLGGHSGWQLMFTEPKMQAAVLVVGCPDYMELLRNRAKLSKLKTFRAEDGGASFLGSRDFPSALVEACCGLDPKGIVFSTREAAWPSSELEQRQARKLLADRIAGKRFLVCSGGSDKLVPYRCSEAFLDFFKKASERWTDTNFSVENNVYSGIGHVFSADMVKDAVRFICDAVAADEASSGTEGRSSKI